MFSLSECVGDQPSLDLLWFGAGPEVSALRLMSFLSIFDCQDFFDLCGAIEDSLLAALCLITYIVLQVVSAFLFLFNSFQLVKPNHIKKRIISQIEDCMTIF